MLGLQVGWHGGTKGGVSPSLLLVCSWAKVNVCVAFHIFILHSCGFPHVSSVSSMKQAG